MVSIDRISQLGQKKEAFVDLESGNEIERTNRMTTANKNEDILMAFFEKIKDMQRTMEILSQVIQELERNVAIEQETLDLAPKTSINATQQQQQEYNFPSSSNAGKSQQAWLKCNKDLIRLKSALKDIDNEIKSASKTTTKATSIMKNQYSLLLHKYLELMQKFQSAQQRQRDAFKGKIARQIRIVKPEAKQEEIENVIKDGVTNVFCAEIAISIQKNKAKDLMIDIQEQHDQVLKIEKSIYDLQQLFIDVQALVQAQDHIINNIEANVNSTEMYTEKGIREMRNAVKKQKRWRKFILWTMFILIVIGGIVCAIVFGRRLMH